MDGQPGVPDAVLISCCPPDMAVRHTAGEVCVASAAKA